MADETIEKKWTKLEQDISEIKQMLTDVQLCQNADTVQNVKAALAQIAKSDKPDDIEKLGYPYDTLNPYLIALAKLPPVRLYGDPVNFDQGKNYELPVMTDEEYAQWFNDQKQKRAAEEKKRRREGFLFTLPQYVTLIMQAMIAGLLLCMILFSPTKDNKTFSTPSSQLSQEAEMSSQLSPSLPSMSSDFAADPADAKDALARPAEDDRPDASADNN